MRRTSRHAALLALSSCLLLAVSLRETDELSAEAAMGALLGRRGLAEAAVEVWGQVFGPAPEWFPDYAASCLGGYLQSVPYHNAEHAFDVFRFSVEVFGASKRLGEEGAKAIALAALCHDFGHPGLNNGFMALYHADPSRFKSALDPGSELARAVEAIRRNATPVGGWSAVGGGRRNEMGTFIPYWLSDGTKLIPQPHPPFVAKGCAKEGHCTSIEESYHAKAALEILQRVAPSVAASLGDRVRHAILETDFGKDYLMREELADPDEVMTEDFLQGLAIHTADINAASSSNFLWWAAAVMAEFAHQNLIGGGGPPPLAGVQAFATSQLGWSLGVRTLLLHAFAATGVAGTGHAGAARAGAERSVEAWERCVEKTKGDSDRPFAWEGKTPLEMREMVIKITREVCGDELGQGAGKPPEP